MSAGAQNTRDWPFPSLRILIQATFVNFDLALLRGVENAYLGLIDPLQDLDLALPALYNRWGALSLFLEYAIRQGKQGIGLAGPGMVMY